MTILDIKKIQTEAAKRICVNGMERQGQAIFNAAYELYPVQTESLKKTKFDPFYDDDRINEFLVQLQKL